VTPSPHFLYGKHRLDREGRRVVLERDIYPFDGLHPSGEDCKRFSRLGPRQWRRIVQPAVRPDPAARAAKGGIRQNPRKQQNENRLPHRPVNPFAGRSWLSDGEAARSIGVLCATCLGAATRTLCSLGSPSFRLLVIPVFRLRPELLSKRICRLSPIKHLIVLEVEDLKKKPREKGADKKNNDRMLVWP